MRSGLAGRERRQARDVRTDHLPNWTDGGRTIRHAVARPRVSMCCSSHWTATLSDPDTYSHIALAHLFFALYLGVTLPLLRIVMVFGVLHLSLSQVRHADLLECSRRYFSPSLWLSYLQHSPPTGCERRCALAHGQWPQHFCC
jgi:hypothetical protein